MLIFRPDDIKKHLRILETFLIFVRDHSYEWIKQKTFRCSWLFLIVMEALSNRTTGDEVFGGDTNVPAESRYTTKKALSWHTITLTVC